MTSHGSIILRLTGPLQSWGTRSHFNRRDTGPVPTKSGVVGLLAAADGRRRTDPIQDLAELRLTVRIDEPGEVLRDYHTVRGSTGATTVTNRYFLQDALFITVVTGRREVIEGLADALMRPAYPLALGRRSCPPAQPLLVPVQGELVTATPPDVIVGTLPWQVSDHWREIAARRRRVRPAMVTLATVAETDTSDPVGERMVDVPVSFDPGKRTFATRRVRRGWVTVPSGYPPSTRVAGAETANHDPFLLLGG